MRLLALPHVASDGGTPNEVASLNGVEIPIADQMKFYDAWGSDLPAHGGPMDVGVRHSADQPLAVVVDFDELSIAAQAGVGVVTTCQRQ